ncbi:retrovirus-related pol polyprotein from transposon TNT 1-94, partial [Tanacetum coccineum]
LQVVINNTDSPYALVPKKKALNIKLPLLEHLNRTALSKDGTVLLLRLLERCFQLLSFHYHFGLKQLQPHAILKTDQSSYRLIERRQKFLGTVRFGNDQFAPIIGYGDLNQGNVMIKRVYYVEGLNHNLFSVGQFCDADLEVAYMKSTCFVRDLQGNDLLTGNRGSDLYTISLQETTSSTPICFMAKASPTQACKAKRSSFKSKAVPVQRDAEFASHGLVWSNAGCKHKWEEIYSGTEFLNKTLHAYFKEEGIEHQTSTPRTPEQNGVVERRNRTLVEAARTMLSASKLPLSFWAEAVATACYTQNRSIIISTHGKTGIHIINDRITFNKNIFHLCLTEIIEMMSDHTVDLAPQRQEMSVENVSSGLVPQGQKASDYDNSDPVPPRQNVVPTAEKTDSSQQGDYKKLVESSSASLHNTDVHFISTTKLATDPEMCMFALTVSIVEPKNIKEAMADSAWIEAMQDELHQFDRLQVWDIVDKPFGKLIIKAKVVMEETSRMTIRNCNSQQSRDLMGLLDPDHQKKSTSGKDFVWIKGKLQGAWWQPTGRILKTVCLRWVPTGKTFASSTTKVESEPLNGSNADIPNQCESEQAFNVSAGTLLSTAVQASVINVQMMSDHNSSDLVPQRQEMSVENNTSGPVVRLGINPMIQPEPEDLPKDNPKLEIAVLRVILFSIHNDEWKSFQCHHQTALRSVINELTSGEIVSLNFIESIKEARSRVQDLTSGEIVSLNFIESIKEVRSRVQDLTSGEIVSLNLLSRTRKLGHSTMELRSLIRCCLTSWLSKKQIDLAISTTEVEYISAGKACQQALWMKQALIDYDVQLDDVPIMCDNKGAIDLSKTPVKHSRTKHIKIRHHFLRDNVQKGHISIEKVSSIDNIADILTKPLKRKSFNYLRLGFGMMEHIP